jgi:hypothetical protein
MAHFQYLDETLWGWLGTLRIAESILAPRAVGRPCNGVGVRLGRREPRYLLCTGLPLSAKQIVRLYAGRVAESRVSW